MRAIVTALAGLAALALAAAPAAAQTAKKNAPAASLPARPAAAAPDPAAAAAPSPAPDTLTSRLPVPAGSLRFENDADSLCHFLVLPAAQADARLLAADPAALAALFNANAAAVRYLPARTVWPALPAADGELSILGLSADGAAYRAWSLAVPARSKRPGVPVYAASRAAPLAGAAGAPVRIAAVNLRLPSPPVRIDGRFVEWLKRDDLLAFDTAFRPTAWRSAAGARASLALADAAFWHRAGTDIERFRAGRGADELYLYAASTSVLSPGLSLILRLHAPAAPGAAPVPNAYTLEVPVDAASGPVLLWERGRAEPRVVGDFAAADYLLEARVRLADLPPAFTRFFADAWTCELATAYSQPDLGEEFLLGRFPSAAIKPYE